MPPRSLNTPSNERSDRHSPAQSDEVRYLHFDQTDQILSWPVADYGEQGFFNEQQKLELASRHGLSSALINSLSLRVGNVLDSESLMSLAKVSRTKAVNQTEAALRRAIRHAHQDAGRRRQLEELLLSCEPLFAETTADATLLSAAQSRARDPECCLTDLITVAKAVLQRPGAAVVPSPADWRKVHDGRRHYIVRVCCYIWMDAERRLTYTTRSDRETHEQRSGPLFDLIRDVIGTILPKGRLPSDETIRKDIDRFRKAIARHPELLDGQ